MSTAADTLLALLQVHRSVMLRSDPGAVTELEGGTRRIEEALSQLATKVRQAGSGAIDSPISPTMLASLRDELQAQRATLAALAAGNRRALNALFGEPSLYQK